MGLPSIKRNDEIATVDLGAGPCATKSCEPRQVRKEATVSGRVCVPQDHLAPTFFERSEKSAMKRKTAMSFLILVMTTYCSLFTLYSQSL